MLLFARWSASPGVRSAALLGFGIGLAALTRAEAALSIPLLGVAAMFASGARVLPWRTRLTGAAVLVLVASSMVGAWMLRNLEAMGTPQLSTNSGVTLAGANCDETYAGEHLGSFRLPCVMRAAFGARTLYGPDRTDKQLDAFTRQAGITHAREHRGRLPVVAAARVARSAGVWSLEDQLAFDVREGRNEGLQRLGMWFHLALLPFVVAGAVILWRTRRRDALLVGAVLTFSAAFVAVALYGSTRMRATAEPVVALFAAVAIVWLLDRLLGRRVAE
ncbi:MAG: hypothetical protein KF906_03585 [Actinobacteria bacterium]|nr:hypothetical protein [Actinomycetota bacterium]